MVIFLGSDPLLKYFRREYLLLRIKKRKLFFFSEIKQGICGFFYAVFLDIMTVQELFVEC